MLQTFKFKGPTNVATQGTTLHYLQSETPVVDERIDVYANGSVIARLVPGDEVQLPDPVQQWEVIPVSPLQGGLITVGIGRLRRSTTRYQRDAVTQNTIREIEFSSWISRTAAAGLAPCLMLEAKTTSLLVRGMGVQPQTAGTVRWFRFDGTPSAPAGSRPMTNRYAVGMACDSVLSAADVANPAAPVVAGVTFGDQLGERLNSALGSSSLYWAGNSLFVLRPGEGIAWTHSTLAGLMYAFADVQALELGASWETF